MVEQPDTYARRPLGQVIPGLAGRRCTGNIQVDPRLVLDKGLDEKASRDSTRGPTACVFQVGKGRFILLSVFGETGQLPDTFTALL